MLARIAKATQRPESFFDEGDDDEESDPLTDLALALRNVVRAELRRARIQAAIGEDLAAGIDREEQVELTLELLEQAAARRDQAEAIA